MERKCAIDAEMADFRTNERFEDWFMISGLEKIPSELVGKEWQDAAVQNVQVLDIRLLMGKELPIVVVQNATKRIPNAEVTYSVRMAALPTRRQSGTSSGLTSSVVGASNAVHPVFATFPSRIE